MYGTLSVSDLLAVTTQSVADYGEGNVWEVISNDLAAHNQIVREDLMMLVEVTTDSRRAYGAVDTMTMNELDEHGTSDAQKVTAAQTLGFPLRKYGAALQWTRDWFLEHTPAELAAQYNAMKRADLRNVSVQIRNAVFKAANYTFTDRLIDNTSIAVKRLLNADSTLIPPDRYGNTFDGTTHTHYLASATITTTILDSLITAIMEHDPIGPIHVYINKADEAAVRALSGFTAYNDPRLILGNQANQLPNDLDLFNLEDRRIGIYGAAEIWVKSWVPANYFFVRDFGVKPLVMRVRRNSGGFGELRLVADNETFPLRAQQYLREFGLGVWNRHSAAVARVNNGTYADPTVT